MITKQKVFSRRLEAIRDSKAVTSPGSAFHSLAASTGNSRSPTVTSCVGWTSRWWHMNEGADEKECQRQEVVERTGSGSYALEKKVSQRR